MSNEAVDKIENNLQEMDIDEQQLPGQMVRDREDEVINNAGGFVFAVDDTTRVRRFLILGCSGGTYYSSEREMKLDNAQAIIDIIKKGDGDMILREIREISLAGRNPKQEPLMYALALCARYGVVDTYKRDQGENLEIKRDLQKAAFGLLNDVCRIPTHLFMFVKFCEEIANASTGDEKKTSTGWGRLMRAAISSWYHNQDLSRLAMQLTKYRQRDGWSHRDIFRLSHPEPRRHLNRNEHELEVEQLYYYAVNGTLKQRKRKLTQEEQDAEQTAVKYTKVAMDNELNSPALNMIEAFISLSSKSTEEEAVKAIKEFRLVREHIPTELLNSVSVWQALLDNMPMTAMIRNLGKLSSLKALDAKYTKLVVDQLTNEEKLKAAKIHPITILLSLVVYQEGHGDKGKLTWEVDPQINAALEIAFYKSFINAPPTNKRFCFAYDVSGSMCSRISGTMLSCRTASAALSLVSLRNEQHTECIGFSHELITLPFDKTWDLKKIEDYMDTLDFGATDCALPMLWAKEHKKEFDVFIVYTDCETWFGNVKPVDALRQYREASGITDAKLIVMGMTSSGFTIADPNDANMLDIVGFDSAVPTLIHDFVTGEL